MRSKNLCRPRDRKTRQVEKIVQNPNGKEAFISKGLMGKKLSCTNQNVGQTTLEALRVVLDNTS